MPGENETTLTINNVVTSVSVKKLEKTLNEKLKPGEKLHQELCGLYGCVASQTRSNFQQFVDCIQDLAHISAYSLQLFEAVFPTVDLKNIAKLIFLRR